MDDFQITSDSLPAAAPPRRVGIVALLLLASFVPRAVAAWNWEILWGDTLHYVYASQALEHGDFERGFSEFGLNVYPLLLIPLRHLGIDWQIAGKWFSVLAATLAVVPLWGWLRRLFDDRVALLACLIYAVHGKLIAISPLIIRDSTFWLLFSITLYYLWRAASEARLSFFLAGGITLTLAVHTRTEGWLLIVPLLGWIACRRRAAVGHRAKLMLGTLLCLAVIPASVAAVNATWLRENPRWDIFRTVHWHIALDWLFPGRGLLVLPPDLDAPPYLPNSAPPPSAARGTSAAPPATSAPVKIQAPRSILLPATLPSERTAPPWLLTFKLLERLAKGLTWAGSLLLLIGIACHARTFLRPEHLALLTMNVLLLIISGIRYKTIGLDFRYFMPMVLVGLPWMALGGRALFAALLRPARRRGDPSVVAKRSLATVLAAGLAACSLLEAAMPAAARMQKHVAVGRWIHDRAGGTPALAGNVDHFSLDAFYSQGQVIGIVWPRDCLIWPMPAVLVQHKADFVLLWNVEDLKPEHLALVERRITDYCDYRRVPPLDVPAGENEVMIFVRK